MGRLSWWLVVAGAVAGCTSSGGDAEPAVTGGYEVASSGAWQRALYTSSGMDGQHDTSVVASTSSHGFTRRIFLGSGAGYVETDYRVERGALYQVADRFYDLDDALRTSFTYDPPWLLLPADTSPHALPVITSTATLTSPNFPTTTDTKARQVTVDGPEAVTVPAGAYQALKVSTVIGGAPGVPSEREVTWWAAGVGRVKMEWLDHATSALHGRWSLEDRGPSAPPPVPLYGTFDVQGYFCGGGTAPAALQLPVTGGRTLSLAFSGAAVTSTWDDGVCSVTLQGTATYPSMGTLVLSPTGTYACSPGGAPCADLVVAVFGRDVCGLADQGGPVTWRVFPSRGVNRYWYLDHVGGQACSEAGASGRLGAGLVQR